MTFGLSDPARRRRRRLWGRVARFLFLLACLLVVAVFSYRVGVERAQEDVGGLRTRIAALAGTNARLARERDQAVAERAAALARAKAVQARYDREVPTGPSKALVALLKRRLAEGVPAERLGFVIGAATAEAKCDADTVTKRFIVQTPLYNGPNGAVSFGDNAITVTGEGESARDAGGNPEAWYDPAAPVTLHFIHVGGEAMSVNGKLPLHHSVVLGDTEYRFTVLEGARGFVKVAANRCAYP